MYTEIQVDISYFNQDTKQIVLHIKMHKKHKAFSQLVALTLSLTEAVLNWSPSCFATAATHVFTAK